MKWTLINRDPDPAGGAGGAGGDGGQGGGDGGAGGGAGAAPEWVKALPEPMQKDPNITKYKTADEFHKGYQSTVELVGRKGVIIPKDDAAPEEREKFYNALGRPEKPEGYKFSEVKDLHPAIANPKEITTGLQGFLYKIGAPNSMADAINKEFLGLLSESARLQEERQTTAMQTTETALRKEWAGNYDANKALVGRLAASTLTAEELAAVGGAEGLGNNPIINKLIHGIGKHLSEDTIKNISGSPQTGGSGNESPEQAKKEIAEIEGNKEGELHKAWMDDKNPKHKEVVARRMKLYQIAYPEGGE